MSEELQSIPGFLHTWSEWWGYRAEKRQKLVKTTVTKQFRRLVRLAGEGYDINLVIETAMEKGWTGFFEKDWHKKPHNGSAGANSHEDLPDLSLEEIGRLQ